jgi:hypothetical protein
MNPSPSGPEYGMYSSKVDKLWLGLFAIWFIDLK